MPLTIMMIDIFGFSGGGQLMLYLDTSCVRACFEDMVHAL